VQGAQHATCTTETERVAVSVDGEVPSGPAVDVQERGQLLLLHALHGDGAPVASARRGQDAASSRSPMTRCSNPPSSPTPVTLMVRFGSTEIECPIFCSTLMRSRYSGSIAACREFGVALGEH